MVRGYLYIHIYIYTILYIFLYSQTLSQKYTFFKPATCRLAMKKKRMGRTL